MVLSVLDGSTIRTPHNIYVLDPDGSTIRRVREIRALDPDGSTIRHPFTKTDYFDFSGTADTLTSASAEEYTWTFANSTNRGTETTYTGTTQTSTSITNKTNTYYWFFSAGNPGSVSGGNTAGAASWTRAFSNQSQARYLTGLSYFPNHASISCNINVWIRVYNAVNFHYGNVGVYDATANIAGGVNNWTTYTHFVGPTTWAVKYMEPHGGPSVSGGTSGASPQFTLRSGSAQGWGWWGGQWQFNSGGYQGLGLRGYVSSYSGYGSQMGSSWIYMTMVGQESTTTTTNVVNSSSANVNLGATFSVSGDGWSVPSTAFSNSNGSQTHRSTMKNAINNALPSGWSCNTGGGTVNIIAPSSAGNVADTVVNISNGSGINQGTNPSPGQTFVVRPASNVSGSGSTVQGVGQSGNLTSATVTSGGNSTSINLLSGASTDTAGAQIANAMHSLADTTATYDSGTNRMTVVAPGDTSVSLTNPNTLTVTKQSL